MEPICIESKRNSIRIKEKLVLNVPQTKPLVEAIVQRHFSDTDVVAIHNSVYQIAIAVVITKNERIGPQRWEKVREDRQLLKEVEEKLAEAVEGLSELGSEGKHFTKHSLKKMPTIFNGYSTPKDSEIDLLDESIGSASLYVQELLSVVSDAILGFEENFPEHLTKKRGRPANSGARTIAWACAQAYFSILGKQPTIVVDAATSSASGEYLDFLSDVLETFDIHASGETWARNSIQDFKEGIGPESWN